MSAESVSVPCDVMKDLFQSKLVPAVKRLEGRSNSDRYFRKSDDWEPNWNFYAGF